MGNIDFTKKRKYTLPERVLDAAALAGMGAAGGLALGVGIASAKSGLPVKIPRFAAPTPSQAKLVRRIIRSRSMSYGHGLTGALAGGAAGAAVGGVRSADKDNAPLPVAAKASGILAAAGGVTIATRNKGKIMAALKGKLRQIDPWGYKNPIDDIMGRETHIPLTNFHKMYDSGISDDVGRNLSSAIRPGALAEKSKIRARASIKTLKNSVSRPGKGKSYKLREQMTVSDKWKRLYDQNSPYIKAVGGDPEMKVYLKIGRNRMPVDIAPVDVNKVYKTKSGISYKLKQDITVGGVEITTAPEKDPDKLFGKMNEIAKDIAARYGKDFDYAHPAISPSLDPTNLRAADIRRAGGHLHIQSLIDDTLKTTTYKGQQSSITDRAARARLLKRSTFASIPFDYTHPAMPYRAGVFHTTGDGSKMRLYGNKIMDFRSLKKIPSWDPDKGYINFEYRLSPTYLGGDVDKNSMRVKLMQIINADPNVAKDVDAVMNNVMKATRGRSDMLYAPEIRKYISDEYMRIMNKAGIRDPELKKVIGMYRDGVMRKNAEDKKNRKKIWPLVAGGAAASLAGAAAYNRFRSLPSKLTEVQQASKKGLTIVQRAQPSKKQKALYKLLLGPEVNVDKINPNMRSQSYRGTVFHKNFTNSGRGNYSKVTGDVVINPPHTHDIIVPAMDKSKYHTLPGIGNLFSRTYNLKDELIKRGVTPEQFRKMTDSQADEIIKLIERETVGAGRAFMKPNYSEQMGKGTRHIYAPMSMVRTHRLTKPKNTIDIIKHRNRPYLSPHKYGLSGVKEDPGRYIFQENLNPDGKLVETRIHTYNGKVFDTVTRFGALEGKPKKFFKNQAEKKAFEDSVSEWLKKTEATKGLNNNNRVGISFDAFRDPQGNVRLLEINPNSGFVYGPNLVTAGKPWDYDTSFRMYKHLTGRDPQYYAALKSIPSAVAAGGGAYLGGQIVEEKVAADDGANDKGRRKYIYPAIAAGIGTAALTYGLVRGKKGKMYVLTVKGDKSPVKGMAAMQKITPDELRKIKLTANDSVYSELPDRFYRYAKSPYDIPTGNAKTINYARGLALLGDKAETAAKMPHYGVHLPRQYSIPEGLNMEQLGKAVSSGDIGSAANRFNEAMARQYKLPRGTEFFIKERMGAGSRGYFFSTGEREIAPSNGVVQKAYDLIAKKKRRPLNEQWDKFIRSPQTFIIQEKLPEGREYRVAAYNGKIIGIVDRHGLKGFPSKSSDLSRDDKKRMQEFVKNITIDMRKDIGHGNTHLGHDIIVPADKKLPLRLVESNTQEGYVSLFPNSLYREVHKTNLPSVAATASAVSGGAAYGGSALMLKDRPATEKSAAQHAVRSALIKLQDGRGMIKDKAIDKGNEALSSLMGGDGISSRLIIGGSALAAGALGYMAGRAGNKGRVVGEHYDRGQTDH